VEVPDGGKGDEEKADEIVVDGAKAVEVQLDEEKADKVMTG
jgi:hypothetical protein